MKEFLKNNCLYIISFIILLVILIYNVLEFTKQEDSRRESLKESIELCENITQEELDNKYKQYCESVDELKEYKTDMFTAFQDIVLLGVRNITTIMFFFIGIPSLYYLSKKFKDKKLKKDKKLSLKIILSTYKGALIIPLIVIIAFIISYILTGTMQCTNIEKYGPDVFSAISLNHPILLIVLYTIKVLFISIFYTNICLIIGRKSHNIFISTILSFIVLILIQLFSETILTIILNNILNNDFSLLFNPMDILNYKDYYGIIWPIIVSLIYVVISLVIVYLLYKDKEKLKKEFK